MLRFDEVVFMDDFFRCAANGLTSHPANRRFLRALFETSCRRLGLVMRDVFADCDGGEVPVGTLMDRLGLERSTSGWAAASIADVDPAVSSDLSLGLSARSLVIGWGLPPSLLNHIANVGAAFIDIEVDPVRFARHLYLCARTNDNQVLDVLQSLAISREMFWNSASTIRASFARKGVSYLVGPDRSVGLFAGQTEVDLALVADGRIATPEDYLEQVSRWAEEVDILLIKRHPYSHAGDALSRLVELVPNAMLVDHNIYGMLTATNLRFVGALSSGVLREAEYFGVESRRLVAPDRTNPARLPARCSPWVTVTADIGSIGAIEWILRKTRFWQHLMRGRVEPEYDPNALDKIFGFRWGMDLDAPGLSEHLSPNKVFSFAQSQGAVGWLADGWHGPESWGVWSSERISALMLPLDGPALRDAGILRLAFRGRCFGGARVTGVEVDGEMLLPAYETNGELVSVSVEVDGRRFAGRAKSAVNLHIEGAASPIDLLGLPDRRSLGFGLYELQIFASQRQDSPTTAMN